ncbi:MAG: TM2 domain-containing protein [Lachnospiraceae bacterium]|jgi:restriction system protein|nr:TM2 domain-containing protein [Lachnospiraceae bacterium]
MQCPRCGAEAKGKFCEYCGCELPRTAPENVNYSSSQTVINNYYQAPPAYSGQQTQDQYVYQPPQQSESRVRSYSYKSRTIALILCVCLGYLGGHYFYVGKFGMGLLYFFTAGLFGIGWIVDIIRIAMGTFPDKQDRILV